MSICFFGCWFSQLVITVAWSFLGLQQMKSDFIYRSQTLVKLGNFSLQCEEWLVCFIAQFSLGLFENKELRSVLGHIFKGALIMSVLLFLLSNYKPWKFPLKKTASYCLTWALHALCHVQALLHSWMYLLESAVIFTPSQTVQCVLFREWNWFEKSAVDNYDLGKSKLGGEYVYNCQGCFGGHRLPSLSIIYHLTTVVVVNLPGDSAGNLENF